MSNKDNYCLLLNSEDYVYNGEDLTALFMLDLDSMKMIKRTVSRELANEITPDMFCEFDPENNIPVLQPVLEEKGWSKKLVGFSVVGKFAYEIK